MNENLLASTTLEVLGERVSLETLVQFYEANYGKEDKIDELTEQIIAKVRASFDKALEVTEATEKNGLPMSAYLVIEDEEKVTTWHLPVYDAEGNPDHIKMGAAWAALHGGYRGSVYEGPNKEEAITKLTALYKSEEMETPAEQTENEEEEEETEMSELCESFSGISILSEGTPTEDSGGPLTIRAKLIQPGFGNKKDNHYYSAEMLKACADRFIGAKMHETDHVDQDKTTRSWVSTVIGINSFTDDGAPVAEVLVHDPSFIERVRNLEKGGLLDQLPCSILADGIVEEGEIDGQKASIVKEITEVKNVDWVTKAGAGGQALSISETDKEVAMLEKEIVKTVLDETNLPGPAKTRLAESEYKTKDSLDARIEQERRYLTEISDIGKPKDMNSAPVEDKPLAPIEEREGDVLKRYGLGR